MNTLQYELNLFRTTLDWVKSLNLHNADTFIPYYERYYEIASVHKPILSEDWSKDGGFRHGPNSIRGTTSELLTVVALTGPLYRFEVKQIPDKINQKWGLDLVFTKGAKEFKVSSKTCKPRNVFIEGKLETQVRVYEDHFKSGSWRIDFLSLAHPETRQVYLFNYQALGSKFCSVDNNIYKPLFTTSTELNVESFEREYKNSVIHFDLNKG